MTGHKFPERKSLGLKSQVFPRHFADTAPHGTAVDRRAGAVNQLMGIQIRDNGHLESGKVLFRQLYGEITGPLCGSGLEYDIVAADAGDKSAGDPIVGFQRIMRACLREGLHHAIVRRIILGDIDILFYFRQSGGKTLGIKGIGVQFRDIPGLLAGAQFQIVKILHEFGRRMIRKIIGAACRGCTRLGRGAVWGPAAV